MTDFSFTLPFIGAVTYSELALPAVILGALIDSINPCAFGVLIFLMTYLMKVFDDKHMMLVGGLLYTGTVFVTYFIAGLGLLSAVQSPTVSYWFYWIATFVAFTAAAFEIKDYFWYGKGVSMEMVGAKRLKQWMESIHTVAEERPKTALFMTVPIGFAAAAFELPCTGQVYLAILSMIHASSVPATTWVPWLALYNLIFVAPLLIITALLYWGTSSDAIESWRRENRKYMRLAAGVFLYAVGAILLYFTFRQFPAQPSLRLVAFILLMSQLSIFAYIYRKIR
jgi:cytochrome c biogenesis protein CcdA